MATTHPPELEVGEEHAGTALPSVASSSTQLSESFDPIQHSWILVPDSPVVTAHPATPVLAESGEVMLPESVAPDGPAPDEPALDEPAPDEPTPMSPPGISPATISSPAQLHESGLVRDNDTIIAALAVSEILSAETEWPLPLSQTQAPATPPLTSSDASYEEPPLVLGGEARNLGAIAFPATADVECLKGSAEGKPLGGGFGGLPAHAEEEEEDFASEAGSDFGGAGLPWSPWARPIAIVAVLLASHAACLLVGVALGRVTHGASSSSASSSSAANEAGCYLTRRFSSGASGAHARLCMA